MQIVSKNNPTIKTISKLNQKKFRDVFNLAIIEGEKNVVEAFNAGVVDTIVFTEKYANSNLNCIKKCNKKLLVDINTFKSISSETTPQEILACIKIDKKPTNLAPTKNFLVCDNIQNPGNLGAIFRSALASGFLDVYLINCVDTYNSKVLNSSAGNIFNLNIYNTNYNEIALLKKQKNVNLCATTIDGQNLNTFKPNKNVVYGLIMGNEGNGVSSELKSLADVNLTITMQNNVESLNVAVAASLIMYKFNNLI